MYRVVLLALSFAAPQGVAAVPAVAAGHTNLALKSDGTVWAWASPLNPAQVSGLTGVVGVSAGAGGHNLAVKSDGTVWAWGLNNFGQLGDGSTADSLSPVQVIGTAGTVGAWAGDFHSLAVKSDGTVWAWGLNNDGQLGDGTTTNRLSLVQVSGLTGGVGVSAGGAFSLALKSNGAVWAWGNNADGEPATAPQRIV